MKVSIITFNESEYGYKLLNHAQRTGLDIDCVFVVQCGLSKKIRMFRSMFVRHVGFFDAFVTCASRLISEAARPSKEEWEQRPLIRDYTKLASKVVETEDKRDQRFLEEVKNNRPDILLLGQAGIIHEELLAIPRICTLNSHPGWLPDYKGNHVLYWTCLNKEFQKVGYTVHKVDSGIDTGEIVSQKHIQPEPGDTIADLEERLYDAGVKALVESATAWEKASQFATIQRPDEGKMYYAMPLKLQKQAENNLKRYTNAAS